MLFVKVNNLKGQFNQIDYKGLNTSLFVAGSQAYANDLSYCVLITRQETIEPHSDLEVISEAQYNDLRQQIKEENEQNSVPSRIDQIEQSQADQDEIIMGILLGRV